jgi:gamma-glutamylcyclotransferase (GGCT)/AIG2-like uncharacterized protein YtfP
MRDLLFVYGTLKSDFDNPWARLLRSSAEFAGKAFARGSVTRIGGYLAFQPGPEGEVQGELYRLNNPASTLAALDEYEGEGYERVRVKIGEIDAWVYRRAE